MFLLPCFLSSATENNDQWETLQIIMTTTSHGSKCYHLMECHPQGLCKRLDYFLSSSLSKTTTIIPAFCWGFFLVFFFSTDGCNSPPSMDGVCMDGVSWIRSTQRPRSCQCHGCMNICDGGLPQLAGADASCVDLRICLSHWSARSQCCAARQNCKSSWLSSHQKSLFCHASCPLPTPGSCSAQGAKRGETQTQQPTQSVHPAKWTWEKLNRVFSVQQQRTFSCRETQRGVVAWHGGYVHGITSST